MYQETFFWAKSSKQVTFISNHDPILIFLYLVTKPNLKI